MAINKKLIHFKSKTNFLNEYNNGNILPTSIVFILDAKQIWTHNQYYSCPYSVEELETIFGEKLNKLESTIITNGDGNSYLTDDGSYKDLGEYQKVTDADLKYATIENVSGFDNRLEVVENNYIDKTTAATKVELMLKQDVITDLDQIRTGARLGLSSVQNISHLAVKEKVDELLLKKVDIVEGKQLSTEDFTTELKAKLQSLNNYNDSELSQSISDLSARIDTLVNADASIAINTFNEIVKFLEGIENTEDLDNIIASIEQLIAAINTALDNYLTKTDASSTYLAKNAKAVSATSADSATKATLDASGNVITSTYATKTELSGKASTSNATQSANGLMSASDKTKLDGIASGATAVTTNTVSSWGYTKNTGTVTSVATGKGLTGGAITSTGTIKCNLNSETSLGTIGTTSKLYAVGVDANNKLCVSVPWTDTNTDTDTHWTTGINAGASGAVANSARTNPYVTVKDNSTYRSQIRLVGGGSTTVKSDASGNITISSTDTNTWRPLGTTADTACAGNDSRLSNARPASDVYSWAKASTKPSYTYSEVGAAASSHTHDSLGHLTISTKVSNHVNPTNQALVINSTAIPSGTTLSLKNSPGIGFHIANNSWASFVMKDGSFHCIDNSGTAYTNIYASKFIKNGSSSSYVLLGNGDHKAVSDFSISSHTHNYAGSSSAGGSATSAVKLDSSAGNSTTPVYFSGGKPVACTAYSSASVNYANSAGSVAWSNVSGRPSSLPASDVYSWAKASTKPSYNWSEIRSKPTIPTNTNQLTNGAGFITGITNSMVTTALGYTTASTVASLNVNYRTIYVTLNANASLSASAVGATYNGRSITAYVYTSAARTITIPTSGNYVSMCGSSYTTTAGKWVEFNLVCVNGIWHIAKLEQE